MAVSTRQFTTGDAGSCGDAGAASVWEHLGFFLGYLSLSVVLLAPMSFSPASRLPDDGDSLQGLWIIWWGASHLFSEPGQLFHANSYYPHPLGLAYSEPMLAEALLAWPLFAAISNRVLAINLLTFLSLGLSAFACHLLVRELTGSRLGALTAALFYAFNSYVFSHLAQLQLVSVQWIPLALLSLHRFFTRGQARYALAFGIFLTLVGLASFYYLAFFSVALAILLPVYFWAFRGWRRPRKLAVLMAALLGSAVIVLAVASPYQELFARYGFTGETATLDLRRFFEPPNGSLIFGDLAPYRLMSYFLGYVALGLGIWGLVSLARGGQAAKNGPPLAVWIAYALTGILAFLFAAGPHLWLDGRYLGPGPFELLRIAGPFGNMREPARIAVLVYLVLAVFIGRGVSQLFGGLSARKQALCAVLVGGLLLAEQWSPRRTEGMEIPVGDTISPVYDWLRDYPEQGAVAELPVRPFHQIRRTSMEAYFATFHERPILFSKPSFYPPAMELMQWELRDFPDERSLSLLRALDVRLALVHPKRWERNRRIRLRRLDRFREALTLLRQFSDRSDPAWVNYQLGAERLYRVAPFADGDGPGLPRECRCREIDRSTFRIEANGVMPTELAIDGDRLTKWTTGGMQQKGFFFEVAFDRPRRPVRVEIEMAFPYGEFARNLEMNGYVGSRGYRVQQIEDVAYTVELVRQLIEDPTKARLRYDIEPMTMERLRLFIHRTEEGTLGWSIPEIHVYERAAEE